MKKIALTVAAVAALGLAACNSGTETAATNEANTVTDLGTTGEEATADVNAAAADAANMALDNLTEATENAAETVENASEAVANAQ